MNYELQELLGYFYEGVYIVNTKRQIIFWNKGSERITGYTAEEVQNSFCYNNILRHVTASGKELCHDGCPLHHTLQTGSLNEAEVFLHHKEGHRVPVAVKSIPLKDDEGNIVAAIEVFTDLRYRESKYKENRELKQLLTIDELTRIPNRRYLDFSLRKKVEEFNEFETPFGILFFDIDFFKYVNDTYGHNIGDEVLKLMAKTLVNNVRTNDIVGRWGGEEFIAVITCKSKESLEFVAEKLRILVEKSSYELDEKTEIQFTVSVGGTMYQKGEDIKETIDRADKLMYKSKVNGRNQTHIE